MCGNLQRAAHIRAHALIVIRHLGKLVAGDRVRPRVERGIRVSLGEAEANAVHRLAAQAPTASAHRRLRPLLLLREIFRLAQIVHRLHHPRRSRRAAPPGPPPKRPGPPPIEPKPDGPPGALGASPSGPNPPGPPGPPAIITGPFAARPCPVVPCSRKESEEEPSAVPEDSSAAACAPAPACPTVSPPAAPVVSASPVKSVCAKPPAIPWLIALVTPAGSCPRPPNPPRPPCPPCPKRPCTSPPALPELPPPPNWRRPCPTGSVIAVRPRSGGSPRRSR